MAGDAETLRLLRVALDSAELEGTDLGLAHFFVGMELRDSPAPASALPHLVEAVKLAPRDTAIAARDGAAAIRLAQEDYEAAGADYRELLAADRNHEFSPDWLILLATCIVDGSDTPSQVELEEAYALTDEAVALLTGPEADRFVTDFPRPRALFDAMVVRALCKSRQGTREALWEAETQFRAAEQYGLSQVGPHLDFPDFSALYSSWISTRYSLGLDDEAQRLESHARRQLAT